MEKQTATTLSDYLKACAPLIYVRTTEDSRGVKHILDAVEEAKLTDCFFSEWTVNKGLVVNGTRYPDKNTISMALDYLISSEDVGVLILHNIRQFVSNFMVIQDLKDAAMICRTKGSYIILIGAEVEFPPEIKDLVTIYDFPLPDKEFFVGIFSEMIGKYKDSIDLPETEEERKDLTEKAANAALGMNAIQGESSLAISIVKTHSVSIPVIYTEKEQVLKSSDVLELVQTAENIDTLGGFDQLKKWIDKRVNGFSLEAKKYGLKPPKGLILCGIAGCGKSLCVKSLASAFEVPLIRFDIGKVFRSLQGSSETAVRQALRTAEAVAPCILPEVYIKMLKRREQVGKLFKDEKNKFKVDANTDIAIFSKPLSIKSFSEDNKNIIDNDLFAIVRRKATKKKIYRVTLTNGLTVKVSEEHKFLTSIGKESVWKKVQNLKVGDLLTIDG